VSAIRTPDQRLRVFISSTLNELADERVAVRRAIERLQLIPVMFELSARPHAPQTLYRAYLDQSHVFVGIYWQSYGWVGPGMTISGLEDEFRLAGDRPRLLYVRQPAPDRDPELGRMLGELESSGAAAYKRFTTTEELEALVAQDLAVLLSERFEASSTVPASVVGGTPPRGWVLHPDNPLLGRSDELADLVELLGRPDVRQVSLTGPAGSGKSRVALEVGVLLADRYPDGIWEVLLDEVPPSDPPGDAIIDATATALGLPRPATVDDLVARLQDQVALLVLDGMEAHAAAGPQLSELLARCPALRVLVTSRVALRLRGEREVPVGPLPTPSGDDLTRVRNVAASRLLVDRIRAIDPSYDLASDVDAAAVAAICRRVDGLPLLLELAAARTRVLPPTALAEALVDDPLRMLASGAQDLPARHRSLRVLFGDSRRLLSPTGRAVLDRLAVFDRGWSLPAAEAVVSAAGALAMDLLEVLDELASHHLVHRSTRPGGPARWALLRTTRAHALSELQGSDDLEPTGTAHARWYLDMAAQHVLDLAGPGQAERLAALDVELPNLRAAADWLEGHGDADPTRLLSLAAARICEVGGRVADGQRWADRGLRVAGVAPDVVHAALLRVAGSLARRRGALDRATERLEDAMVVHEHLDDPVGRGSTLLVLAQVLRDAGEADRARALLEEGLEVPEVAGVDWLVARLLAELGGLAEAAGDRDLADAHLARAAALATIDRDPTTGAQVAVEAAAVALERGVPADALRRGAEAVAGFHRVGNRYGLQEALLVVAAAQLAQDHVTASAHWLGAAEALAPEASGPRAAARLATVAPAARRAALRHARGLAFDDAWQVGAVTPVADLVAGIAAGCPTPLTTHVRGRGDPLTPSNGVRGLAT
jgi:predicted ATPase